jgi:uncharacterized RDD family membrane protein YckC
MDIWIIQDGENVGPIHDFEVRRKIQAGELPPTTPAWHEGLPAWKPLEEIALFEREFELLREIPTAPSSAEAEQPAPASPPPLPEENHSLRRFWARWLDLYLFAGIWWIGMWAAGRDIGATLANMWLLLFFYVPWFALESFLLHRFGTTPGKWLLGLRVCNNDGSLLSLSEATRRSARVLFIGIGFGLDIIAIACQVMAYFTTKRIGKPLWDHAAGHRVTAAPLAPLRIVAFIFILFASLQLRAIVVVPYLMEEAVKKTPQLKEFFEKYPPWHLPKNH